jgi:hypothetical protein
VTGGTGVAGTALTLGGAQAFDYTLVGATGTLTVTPAPLTIDAQNESKTAGAADPTLAYVIGAGRLFGNDTLSGALTRVAGELVGIYPILQGTLGASNTNYAITYVGADLTIIANTSIMDNVLSSLTSSQNSQNGTSGNLNSNPNNPNNYTSGMGPGGAGGFGNGNAGLVSFSGTVGQGGSISSVFVSSQGGVTTLTTAGGNPNTATSGGPTVVIPVYTSTGETLLRDDTYKMQDHGDSLSLTSQKPINLPIPSLSQSTGPSTTANVETGNGDKGQMTVSMDPGGVLVISLPANLTHLAGDEGLVLLGIDAAKKGLNIQSGNVTAVVFTTATQI